MRMLQVAPSEMSGTFQAATPIVASRLSTGPAAGMNGLEFNPGGVPNLGSGIGNAR